MFRLSNIELAEINPNSRIIFILYTTGVFACIYFLISSINSESWIDASMVVIVFISIGFAFNQTRRGNIRASFAIFSSATLFANLVGVIFTNGIKNPVIGVFYPVLLMIAISLRKKPFIILIIGFICILWVGLLYYLETIGFYIGQEEALNVKDHAILVAFTFFFMTIMLQITARNLLSYQNHLHSAREDALNQKVIAETANRAKSTFLANMSHELRTPLNAIIGYSEMIEEAPTDQSEVEGDAQRIQQSARNLLAILNSILEISRIEIGSLGLKIEEVEVDSMINDVVVLMTPQIQQRDNVLNLDLSSQANHVLADKQKLTQVLVNLISNANKFTKGNSITLKTIYQSHMVKLLVIDKGIGIPAENLATIFEPFQQVENEYNRQFEGAGLGLSISRQFVVAMNGKIEVQSQLGQGSIFSVTIPAA